MSIFSGSCELVVKKHNSFTSPQSCLPEGPLSYRSGLCPVCWAFLPVTDLSPSIIVLSPLPVKPIISARKSDSLQCQKGKKENLYFTVVRFKIVPECLGSDLLRIAGHLRRNPQGLCFFFFFLNHNTLSKLSPRPKVLPQSGFYRSFSLTILCNPSADNHCVRAKRMLKVNIFPYLGDLGVRKSCHLEKFCFSNSHHILCALSEEETAAEYWVSLHPGKGQYMQKFYKPLLVIWCLS